MNSNNRFKPADEYNTIDSIREKNEEDINRLLQQLDALNNIEGFADLMDFDEDVDLVPDKEDFEDLLAGIDRHESNDYRFN
ncbi:hypothetical protein KCM76_05520 [Zooshikella marina]|uniref:hypothetical protein n=1 Tax=Zooshikella ganghwensis TaxID=202772 RepID=UPI001BB0CBB2|nr:hypothetical protein [Zooshikella ganghwensis]MBU2705427.1 hypothetical protein [Zooshikella ganghwensis]